MVECITEAEGSPSFVRRPSGQLGFFVMLDHESVVTQPPPTTVYPAVKARLDRDESAMRAFLESLRPGLEHPGLEAITDDQSGDAGPYWNNGYFTGNDARFAFAFVATHKPRTIIEIGSGHSTRFMRRAIEVADVNAKIISIDPMPRIDVASVADETLPLSVLEAPLDTFDRLEAGDLLFHDGSHLAQSGTDTIQLVLQILPRLKPGVFVHVHDISLPGEYPPIFHQRGYGEQYMLAAALLWDAGAWEVVAPVAYLNWKGLLQGGGLSFWMRRL